MVAPLTLGSGLTLGKGITFTPAGSSGPGAGDITLTYTEFTYPSGPPANPPNFEDMTTSITGTGFITTDPTKTGLFMSGLSAPNLAFISANLPDSSPGNSGEIWTANWAAGSTYTSTPVAIYYQSNGFGGVPYPTIIFWILNPSDNTYHTGAAGTFNFPMTLTAGTTTTSFIN
jgi:hypothetical protein